jgi:RNA polymerase sigma factor (sigma-70 family)
MPVSELLEPSSEPETTLHELVAAARGGDQRAWCVIVERHQESLMRAALRWRLGEAAAADVVQQTWLAAIVNIASLREPEALGAWLHAILRRECLRAARPGREMPTAVVEVVGVGRALHGAEPVLPEVEVTRREDARVIAEARDRLGQRDRDLLALTVDTTDVGYREVSRRLGMPIGSIGPTRRRCFARLRRELAALMAAG